ncbi:MAG: DUF885 domain-containing protein [Actinobacteria bacterium]|nr:DUF885 domain-containing protein [Actinomycetota bacterium]
MLDLPSAYCVLGLSFDVLVEGFVDAYTGDPALRAHVPSTPVPAELAADARRLLARLPDEGLAPDRAAFLSAQLTGLEMSARVLAGEPVGFAEQVETYFQARPARGDEDGYLDAHRQLAALLPGNEPLGERYAAYRKVNECPPDKLPAAVDAWSSLLRDRVRVAYPLPAAETIEYVVVGDKPWAGFNYYLGDFRSRVAINSDLPVGLGALAHLVAHESYPGHHTEHCRKEHLLADRPEMHIFLVNTPECLMAEGLADLGLLALGLETGWGSVAQDLYADLGIRFDGERAEALSKAAAQLGSLGQDAALLLHEEGRPEDDVVAYLQRWGLQPPERARKSIEFLTDPLWRAYVSTYVEGERLLRAWLGEDDVPARFTRLLDQALTPGEIRASL